MENILITVIVPVYNVEQYLKRCVNSILSQSFSSFELLLINDGSTDQSGELCRLYEAQDTRVRVIQKKNEGVSATRNLGVQEARGDFVTFIDSDDWVHEDYLSKLYQLVIDHHAEVSVCDYMLVTKQTQENQPKENVQEFTNVEAMYALYQSNLSTVMTIACGKLYLKSLFDDIKFTVGRRFEDESTTYKLLYKANHIVYTNLKLLFYFQHPQSFMAMKKSFQEMFQLIDALEERSVFLKEIGLHDIDAVNHRTLLFHYDHTREIITNRANSEKLTYKIRFKAFMKSFNKTKQPVHFKIFVILYRLNPALSMRLLATYNQRKLKK